MAKAKSCYQSYMAKMGPSYDRRLRKAGTTPGNPYNEETIYGFYGAETFNSGVPGDNKAPQPTPFNDMAADILHNESRDI